MRGFDFNFELFAIDLSHSFYFPERYSISIIQIMSLLFMQADETLLFFCYSCNMYIFALFSSRIKNTVTLSKINKSKSI